MSFVDCFSSCGSSESHPSDLVRVATIESDFEVFHDLFSKVVLVLDQTIRRIVMAILVAMFGFHLGCFLVVAAGVGRVGAVKVLLVMMVGFLSI